MRRGVNGDAGFIEHTVISIKNGSALCDLLDLVGRDLFDELGGRGDFLFDFCRGRGRGRRRALRTNTVHRREQS